MNSEGVMDLAEILSEKPPGSAVNFCVVHQPREPEPDFEAMKRVIDSHQV